MRSRTCFRCGKSGHKAAECEAAALNCALCEAAGRVERGHVLGGSGCPSTAKKPAPREEKAASKKTRQKPKPKGARAPPVSVAMETEA